jgi:hypothetical protein
MPKFFPFSRDGVLPSFFTNSLQEFVGTMASPNLRVEAASSTSVRCPAGAGNDQVAVAIEGRWRYITSTVARTHPGGAAGVYDVYAVAKDNSVSNSPVVFTDSTDYSFDLRITATGVPPTIVPGTLDLYRLIATCRWDGASITAVSANLGAEGALASYKSIVERASVSPAGSLAGSTMLALAAAGATPSSSPSPEAAFYWDPTDFAAGARSVKARLRAQIHTNSVAPGASFSVGVMPVSSSSGGSGVAPFLTVLSNPALIVAGSTVAVSTPGASAMVQAVGADFDLPAGFYVLAFTPSALTASGARFAVRAELQIRQV